jgi:DNA segregation ATPase FtsK/SpoIIIE-like protein
MLFFNPTTSIWLNFSNQTDFPSSITYFFEQISLSLWFLFGSFSYLFLGLIWTCILLIVSKQQIKKSIAYATLFFIALIMLCSAYPFSLFIEEYGRINQYIIKQLTGFIPPLLQSCIAIVVASIALFKLFNYSFFHFFINSIRTSLFFLQYIMRFSFYGCTRIIQRLFSYFFSLKTEKEIVKQNEQQSPIKRPAKKSFFSFSPTNYSLLDCFVTTKRTTLNNQAELETLGTILTDTLAFFGIYGKIETIYNGPVVALFEYAPDLGSKISKIIGLENDLALKLKAPSMRIIAPIPGKSVVGFEIAHHQRETVFFGNLIKNQELDFSTQQIPLIIGVDTMGKPAIIDLLSMPHLLIAGSTGSGKSVGMHSIVASIIALHKPEEVKLIMIDPKRLEFSYYNDIPHLLFPLINDAPKAIAALSWLVKEMERRYIILSKNNVRKISDFHTINPATKTEMPFIVLLIDELADLMMVAGKEIELELARLAQMARAAGIFLIVATQRPSVDVITGLIKVNFPSRIAYRVTSKIDSRTILDQMGADKLLGKGDLLFLHATSTNLQRLHGAFLSNKEIITLAERVRTYGSPEYIHLEEGSINQTTNLDAIDDPLYETIKQMLNTAEEISISMLQRQYRIGFNRSARIIDKLEKEGIVGPAQGSKPRKVLL